MGSYISIGFVFEQLDEFFITNSFRNITNYFIKNGKIKAVKMSKDIDGNEWIEQNHNIQIEDLYLDLVRNYYSKLSLECSILGIRSLNVILRLEKEEDFWGIVLDICESELIKLNSNNDISKITDEIINLMRDIYNVVKYDYSFCDNEAEFRYSPKEFKSLHDNKYSIAILPVVNNSVLEMNIIKSGWNIDGLTLR